MIKLKKILFFSLLTTVAVSPLIPLVKATDGQWQPTVASATWNYDLYRVDRLSFDTNVQGPFKQNGTVFVAQSAKSCLKTTPCLRSDLTLLQNGNGLNITDATSTVTSPFWSIAQDNRFIYFVPSGDKNSWGTVFEYLPQTNLVQTLTVIPRKADELSFQTFAVEATRVYTSIIHKDEKTGAVESKLSVSDYKTGVTDNDFTWYVHAPWQEIADTQNNVVLLKFQFDGGNKQLALYNTTTRKVLEVPGTWTEPPGDIVAAHFLSDGSIQYFQNYRLYTFNPTVDAKPKEHGGATLSWFVDAKSAVQIVGDRMAYVSADNSLYVSDQTGVANFGKALSGHFTLTADTLSYQSLDGYIAYTFGTKNWKNLSYRVTNTVSDVSVGTDAQGGIWYQNATSGKMITIGSGSDPVLTDRAHAIWKGTDGSLYQVTFSPLLDMGSAHVQAVKVANTNTVYLVNGNQTWKIPNPTVYFTWFQSWSEVKAVSAQTLAALLQEKPLAGDAFFAPGTRVKSSADPRVYIVGSDYQLHWIISETVADSIYGSAWNRGILEIQPERLWEYQTGNNVTSHQDVLSI